MAARAGCHTIAGQKNPFPSSIWESWGRGSFNGTMRWQAGFGNLDHPDVEVVPASAETNFMFSRVEHDGIISLAHQCLPRVSYSFACREISSNMLWLPA